MTRLGPLERARARLALHRCASVGAGVEVRGRIWVRGGGRVRLGDRVRLDAAAAPIELHATAGAEIVIGDDVVVEGGTSIEARRLVTIEAGAHVGPSCKVLDNDFHGIAAREAQPVSLPVRVEAGARLGERCILLPGAHVRRGASLRAGTVVRGPPLAAAAGEKGLPPRARGALGRARDQVRIAAAAVRGAVALRRADRDGRVYAFGRVRLSGSGRIHLGDRAMFVEGMIPTRLVAHGGGGIEIGARSIVNYGAHLEARAAIRVGRRCMIASAVRLVDAVDGRIAPIAIGDDVWLAHGVTVLPGVTVGDGSVVSAGSVVTRDVPPRSMAAGNPARSMSLSLAGAGRARAAEPEPEKPGIPDARAGTRRPAE